MRGGGRQRRSVPDPDPGTIGTETGAVAVAAIVPGTVGTATGAEAGVGAGAAIGTGVGAGATTVGTIAW